VCSKRTSVVILVPLRTMGAHTSPKCVSVASDERPKRSPALPKPVSVAKTEVELSERTSPKCVTGAYFERPKAQPASQIARSVGKTEVELSERKSPKCVSVASGERP